MHTQADAFVEAVKQNGQYSAKYIPRELVATEVLPTKNALGESPVWSDRDQGKIKSLALNLYLRCICYAYLNLYFIHIICDIDPSLFLWQLSTGYRELPSSWNS